MIPLDGPPAPPVFLLSCERSGSTLLRWILDAHPDVASPGEVLLARLCHDLYFTISRTVALTLGSREPAFVRDATVERVRGVVDGIMTRYARARGKRLWCDKTPRNLAHLNMLALVFPDARWICLYRDGLDVARSCLEAGRDGFMEELVPYVRERPDDLVAAMLGSWSEKTALLLQLEHQQPERCFRIRYEDVVARPGDALPPLFRFLGVDWDPALIERAFTIPHDGGGGDPSIRETRAIEPGRVGRGRELRTDRLSTTQRSLVNSLLRKLDYGELPVP